MTTLTLSLILILYPPASQVAAMMVSSSRVTAE